MSKDRTLFGVALAVFMSLALMGDGLAMNGKQPPHKPGSPDTAVTLWWVVWNDPEGCGDTPCGEGDFVQQLTDADGCVMHGSGQVTNGGKITLVSTLWKNGDGDPRLGQGGDNALTGRHSCLFDLGDAGLLNPLTAEIHLVGRGHGAPLDDEGENGGSALNEQLTNFDDGHCFLYPDDGGVDDALASGGNVCADLQFSVHPPLAEGLCEDGTEDACHDEQAVFWFDTLSLQAAGIDEVEANALEFAEVPGTSTLWRTPESVTVVFETNLTDLEDEAVGQ